MSEKWEKFDAAAFLEKEAQIDAAKSGPMLAVLEKLHTKSGRTVVQLYRELNDTIGLLDVRMHVKNLIDQGLCTCKGDDLFRVYFKVKK